MKFVRRLSLYIAPFLLITILTLLWTQFIKPITIDFIYRQIPKINSSQNSVTLEINKIDLSLLKLQLIAEGIKVNFKENPMQTSPQEAPLAPLEVEKVNAQIDVFKLIVGQLAFSKIAIESLHWSYNFTPKNADKKTDLPVKLLFQYLEFIPIDRIIMHNTNLELIATNTQAQVQFQIPQLILTHKKKELTLSLNQIKAEVLEDKKNAFSFESHLELSLKNIGSQNNLNIKDFTLKLLDSQLKFSANLQNMDTLITAPKGQIQFNAKLNLQDLRSIYLLLYPQKNRIPSISGLIDLNGDLIFKSSNDITGSLNASTTQVVVDQFKLGQAQVNATLLNHQIEIKEIKLEHPSGSALLQDVRIDKNPPYNFATSLDISNFDLQKLFQSLGLNTIPAGLFANGHADCTGTIRSTNTDSSNHTSPSALCKLKTNISNLWVKTSLNENFNIVKLKQAQLNGETYFNKEGMSYRTDIQIANSKGMSRGKVNFQQGFDIEFESPSLDFNDIESLADIKFQGLLKIKGSTQGNSEMGVINATLSSHNSEIENFRLGDFNSILEYKNAQLRFSKVQAKIGLSTVEGLINFDFKKSSLDGYLNSPNLQGPDILHILNKRFLLPFELSGLGKAELKFNGPFDFWKLNYELKSDLKNGSLAGENFKQLNMNLISDGDQILFKNVFLKKVKTEALIEGVINTKTSDPQFELKVKINPFSLEELDHIISFAPAISGLGYADGQITGSIHSPEIFANFTLREVSYDKVEYPNSQGSITINKENLKFNGQFFGRQIQSDLIWPWNEKNNFSAKVLIHDLNPLLLLPLVSIPQPISDFSSALNAEIDLVSKNRSLSTADGSIHIMDFILRRGNQTLKLVKPSHLIFKSGLSQMENLIFKGEDSFLNIQFDPTPNSALRFNVVADLQLKMLHFLVPFVQTMSGNLVINSQIRLTDNSFELFGDGELSGASVTMKGFPESIQNINTPIEFSKSKIFLNDITAQLGQSDVNGVGYIEIVGAKNVQVNLRAIADNIEVNFPDKILTAGKANVLFSGNWLPYTLKVDYLVSHGLVEKDFESGSDQSLTLKPSPYLPLKQIEQLSPSLSLDINVDLTKGILIKNKLIEGEAVGLLNISGSPESPILKGKIDIKRGSKIIFKDKPFDVQTASINFQQAKEINPDLYISANARVSEYDINVLIQGPAKSPSIKPSSQPPLSESDIFSLLALGITSKTDQNLSSDTQQKQTGLEVLAAISNQSQLNKKIQEKLGLTVQLAPSIDSTKNIAVPKVVVSKKLSDKFNASYSKPFTGNDQNQEVKLQYLYNPKLSLHLNYQNKDTIQQDQISNINSDSKGIWGLDLEYRDEFK